MGIWRHPSTFLVGATSERRVASLLPVHHKVRHSLVHLIWRPTPVKPYLWWSQILLFSPLDIPGVTGDPIHHMSSHRPPPPAQGSQQRPRRQQIAAACKICQNRKGKCDGQRPCAWCRDKEKVCEYEVEVGETRMGATKRKYEDLEQEHNSLLELVEIASRRSDARDILQQLQRGRKVGDLLGLLKEGDITYQARLQSNPRTRRMLLGLLIQSTASLDEIILAAPRVAESQLDISWESSWSNTQALTGRTIDAAAIISAAEATTLQAEQPTAGSSGNRNGERSNNSNKRRLVTNAFSVPAKPWTKLTTDDALVSHLVTVFLNYSNVYWRYVEEDLFLYSMQRGLVDDFCSPFLVNAICAMACLSSEHSAAFLRPEDLMSRGEHFHKEALRLWILERGKASVTNIQALVILSMGAGFRGKDKLGLKLLTIAVKMNHDLPFPSASDNIAMSDKLRARVSASWSAHLFDTLVCPRQQLKHARQVTEFRVVPMPSVSSGCARQSTKDSHFCQISPRFSMCGPANPFYLPIPTSDQTL